MYNFEPYNVLLSIATNTAFVLQGHAYKINKIYDLVKHAWEKNRILTSTNNERSLVLKRSVFSGSVTSRMCLWMRPVRPPNPSL